MLRRFPLHRAGHGLVSALCLVLLACSGGKDVTGPGLPDDDPPPGPVNPGPGDPGPGDPGPGNPGPQPPGYTAAGTYALTLINESQPGQNVMLANPDGIVIGLYRFQPTTKLILDPMGGYSLSLEYSDDKSEYVLNDVGEYKWTGTDGAVLQLSFKSTTWGDVFEGAAAPDGSAAFRYDFDGDGRPETVFGFQQATGS